MMNNIFRELIKDCDDFTTIAADGSSSAEYSGTIDTGCYILNAILSASIYGGAPNNKVTAFAGEAASGKTFFVLGIVKQFLDSDKKAGCIYYDTEAAVTKKMMEDRGIDTNRVIIAEPETIQKFRTHALKFLDSYEKIEESSRPPLIMVLDSLGMLSTTKELEDSTAGNDTRDMTKAQVIKAAFRTITLRLAKLKVPMFITNHVYAKIGAYVPTNEVSGGSGLKYSASSICMLSKSKDRDNNKNIIGSIIKVRMDKSRLSKENTSVHVKLNYDTGLDRYYGLIDLAESAGIFKKVGNKYELPDGSKVFGKSIDENPSKYFTPDILDKLDVEAKRLFQYGGAGEVDVE